MFAALSEHDFAPRTGTARGGTVEAEGFTPGGPLVPVGNRLWKTPRVEREEHR